MRWVRWGGGCGGRRGRLQRLAETHLIGENPVELTRGQREHPVEALDLRAHRHGGDGSRRGADSKRGVQGQRGGTEAEGQPYPRGFARLPPGSSASSRP